MRNLDWTMHFCEYIYEMKLIEAREQVYLMNFKRSNEDGLLIPKLTIEKYQKL